MEAGEKTFSTGPFTAGFIVEQPDLKRCSLTGSVGPDPGFLFCCSAELFQHLQYSLIRMDHIALQQERLQQIIDRLKISFCRLADPVAHTAA